MSGFESPRRRSDLIVSRRETESGGEFVVKLPDSERFFRLKEVEGFILEHLDGTRSLEEIRGRVEEVFEASLDTPTLVAFVDRLSRLGLLEGADSPSAPEPRSGLVRGNLLYLRLKTLNPDRFFEFLVGRVGWFFTPAFVAASLGMTLLAIGVTLGYGEEISRHALQLYRFDSLFLVWLTLISIMVVHEFAHGLTCKRFGGKVQELGVMLLYFQPAMYCNVSDAWLFPEKSRRLWVTFSGALIELFIWSWATLIWLVTEPGTAPNYLALVVMLTSGVKTLFNLNPLIKLDGYYLLSDYLDIPNLRQKAFAYLRTRIKGIWNREVRDCIEATPRERRIYLTYSLLAGSFSIWLLTVIAWWTGTYLIDRFGALGFGLFLTLVFLMFKDRLTSISARHRASAGEGRPGSGNWKKPVLTFVILVGVVGALILVRIPSRVSGEFTVSPNRNADIRAVVPGIVEAVYVKEGDVVEPDDPIARLSDRDQQAALRETAARIRETRSRYQLLLSGPTIEQLELARTSIEKAEERLEYAQVLLDQMTQLYEEGLGSRKDFEEAREAVAIRDTELAEARAALEVLKTEVRPEELDGTEAEIERLEAHKRYLEEELQLLDIVTAHGGVVTTRKTSELVGQYLEKGDLIVEVHELDTVVVEIEVLEKDIGYVEIGQQVVLKPSAFADETFQGVVTSIASSVRVPDEFNPRPMVTVTTELDNSSALLKTEMTGSAKIYGEEVMLAEMLTRGLRRYVRVEFWSWW